MVQQNTKSYVQLCSRSRGSSLFVMKAPFIRDRATTRPSRAPETFGLSVRRLRQFDLDHLRRPQYRAVPFPQPPGLAMGAPFLVQPDRLPEVVLGVSPGRCGG